MEEKELRAIFAENIKKFRNKRGWNQLLLAEKLDISSNFLSEIETGKAWISPITLVKMANALEINVFELFMPLNLQNTTQNELEAEKMRRFAKDLTLALNVSTSEAFKNAVDKVCKEYLC
ncbi:hypothetical protein R84B8_02416 [Treponema sp. R8-4-B8]